MAKNYDKMVRNIIDDNGNGGVWSSKAQDQRRQIYPGTQPDKTDDNSSYRGKSKQEKMRYSL